MMHLIRPHPHLRLLNRVLPVCMVKVQELDRRYTGICQQKLVVTRYATHTAKPIVTPNHNPSSLQPNPQPVANDTGNATK